jgi:phage nucleotide-binding protein
MTDIKLGGVTLTTPKTEQRRLSMVLWGPSGCGKTTLAATAPGKKLWLNFDDGGTASLLDRDDILIADFSREKATIVERWKQDNPMNLRKLIEDESIDTVVVDSITSYATLSLDYGITQIRNATIERPTIAGYGRRNTYVMELVRNLVRLTGMLNKHIILIAHEATPATNDEGVVLHITLLLGGQLPELVPLQLSEVWAMADTGTQRKIAIRPVRQRKPAKSRMFLTANAKDAEFVWQYNADTGKGEGIEDWYKKWVNNGGKKIQIPQTVATGK